jgi:asparagine synthase (glutamine-hydrolysing)
MGRGVMCGIAGWMTLDPVVPEAAEHEGQRLLAIIANRGPDGRGLRLALDGRVGFAHTRLAIIDPQSRSGQPLVDPQSGAFISFDGAIYNYVELRTALAGAGVQFVTESDTEVLLKGYMAQGTSFFSKLRGMYAFAIFDPRTMEVIAARDPLGIKPLYLQVARRRVGFGSSPAAASASCNQRLDPAAAVSVAVLGAVLEPLSPYLGVSQVMPGTCYRIQLGREDLRVTYSQIEPEFPWSVGARENPELLESQVENSVRAHLVSDVPVAIFQSGGLDSTIISALARRLSYAPTLLTVGFEALRGTGADDVPGAADVARRLGLQHRFVYLSQARLAEVSGQFLADMPTPTAGAFNSYLAAQLCRSEGIKVALSDVGVTELLAGYPSLSRRRSQNALRAITDAPPGRAVAQVASWTASRLVRRFAPKVGSSVNHLGGFNGRRLPRPAYFAPEELCQVLQPPIVEAGLAGFWEAYDSLMEGAQTHDVGGASPQAGANLRPILLCDTDWAGMAHGVEIRTPMVDVPLHRALRDHQRNRYQTEDLRFPTSRLSRASRSARGPKTEFMPRPCAGQTAATVDMMFAAHKLRGWNRRILRHWFGDWAIDPQLRSSTPAP